MPDFEFLKAVFSVAGSQEWSVLLKGALMLWLLKEFAWKPVKHIQKKRNGGTEYDQLAKQSMYLEDIRDATREQIGEHAKQLTQLEAIATWQREHARNVVAYVNDIKASSRGHE